MNAPRLDEVFKFRHDDAGEFVTDLSLKWAERTLNRWQQSTPFARDQVSDEEASELAAWLGALRDAAAERSRNFPYFEVEEEIEKNAKKNPKEWKDNPYGVMFVSVVNRWAKEHGKVGQISRGDIDKLFNLVVTDLERL